jgi:hypothetical protein
MPDPADAAACVESLRRALGARAAGLWRLDEDRRELVQVAFAPGPELSDEVAAGFAQATRSVGLEQGNLGIVVAVTTGRFASSWAETLPAEVGSGRWLRAFGAVRSVAVPLADVTGRVVSVLSVALPSPEPVDEDVAESVRRFAWECGWA